MVDKLLKQVEKQEKELVRKITSTVEKAISDLGLPSKKNMEKLSKRINALEKKISQSEKKKR